MRKKKKDNHFLKILFLSFILFPVIFVVLILIDIFGGQKSDAPSSSYFSSLSKYQLCLSEQSPPNPNSLSLSSGKYQEYIQQRLQERQIYAQQLIDRSIDVTALPNGSKSGWKKYISPQGYSIEIPENFAIEPFGGGINHTTLLDNVQSNDKLVEAIFGCVNTFTINITSPVKITTDLYSEILNGSWDPHDYIFYTINGMNAAGQIGNYKYFFTKKGVMFELSVESSTPVSPENIQLFKQIASTFQIN
ncbi:hypothetical protein BH10PAT1_BH10PAT1_5590 [soil metagenome]